MKVLTLIRKNIFEIYGDITTLSLQFVRSDNIDRVFSGYDSPYIKRERWANEKVREYNDQIIEANVRLSRNANLSDDIEPFHTVSDENIPADVVLDNPEDLLTFLDNP
jgi:hypothetical protein